jgi:hypothetical protein
MVCVGDDWAENHHDVELVDDEGRRLARARLPEGLDGITRLPALIAEHLPARGADPDPVEAPPGSPRARCRGDRRTPELILQRQVRCDAQDPRNRELAPTTQQQIWTCGGGTNRFGTCQPEYG